MAKAHGPFASQKAHGKFAKTLTFFTWKGAQRIKKYAKKIFPPTSKQVAIRDLNKFTVGVWQNIDQTEQRRFRQAVWTPHFHGYHYFLHQYITRTLEGKEQYTEAPMKLFLDWPFGERVIW